MKVFLDRPARTIRLQDLTHFRRRVRAAEEPDLRPPLAFAARFESCSWEHFPYAHEIEDTSGIERMFSTKPHELTPDGAIFTDMPEEYAEEDCAGPSGHGGDQFLSVSQRPHREPSTDRCRPAGQRGNRPRSGGSMRPHATPGGTTGGNPNSLVITFARVRLGIRDSKRTPSQSTPAS